MEWVTYGHRFYPDYRLNMTVSPRHSMQEAIECSSRYRLILVLTGTGIVRIDGSIYPLTAPCVYCLSEQQSLELLNGTEIEAHTVHFHPNVINRNLTFEWDPSDNISVTDNQDRWCLKPFLERAVEYNGCIPIDPAMSRYASQIIHEIRTNLVDQPDNSWPCRSRSILLELLFLVSRAYQRGDMGPQRIPHTAIEGMDEVLHYLHVHLADKLKLEDIARRFNTNKTTLNRQFAASTGSTLMAYVNRIRMQLASSMLRNTLLSKDDIMSRVGVIDPSHFHRSFRKQIGYSPSEYREQFCWMLKPLTKS